ncbi:protein pxr1-like [Pitangus sulphuratus]|nr:protein pxr1-like [Pitangus sulphuratus]
MPDPRWTFCCPRPSTSASGMGYLRREKVSNCNQRGVGIYEWNSPADTKVSEGQRGATPGSGAGIPLQRMKFHGEAEIYLQSVEDPMPDQVYVQRKL